MPQILTLGTTEAILGVSPFIEGQLALLSSTGTPTVYGTSHPGRNDADKYLVTEADGTLTTLVSTDFAMLAAADYTASPTAAQKMLVIVLINGVPQARVAAAATPSAGQFKTTEAAGVVTVTLGAAPANGAKIEVLLRAVSEITQLTGGTLVANVRYEVACPKFVVASAAAYLERLLC